jgi:hypothetical protein
MLRELLYGLTVVLICIAVHTTALVLCAGWLVKRRELIATKLRYLHQVVLLLEVCVFIIFLHLIETCIWAFLFWQKDLFPNFETALYFSMGSYTTIGYGDVVLPKTWRLLGAVEGLSGVLLCGLSTAFIFAVVNALFQMRHSDSSAQKR